SPTATMLPQVRNDRNGMRRFQNTTFSIFNSPLSIRPKGAPRLDCFVAIGNASCHLLALTTVPVSLRASGTLPSEAIQ
ncbi:MAG: hypothetical protein LBT00_05130, partial [Spirochaetaceae bacterium]|nr:hypothetical protein [Spirochaetaceae bacterium]